MNKKKGKFSQRDSYKQYLFLIPPLMERNVSFKEMADMLEAHGFNPKSLNSIITNLSNHFPIYSPADALYRILTREQLEEYEQRELERRRTKKLYKKAGINND